MTSSRIRQNNLRVILNFPARLKLAMQGQSNNAFAKTCNMSEKVIRNYLDGKTFPSLDRLCAIADATDKPLSWFLTSDDINTDTSSQNFDLSPQQTLLYTMLSNLDTQECQTLSRYVMRYGWMTLLNNLPD